MLEVLGDTAERLIAGAAMLVAVYYWYIPITLIAISYACYKLKGGK